MQPDSELQTNEVNVTPDIEPIQIPGRNVNPSLDDRISQIEEVLNIS